MGKSIQIECIVDGNPKPEIRWIHQNKTITPSQKYQMNEYPGNEIISSLVINDLDIRDTGSYSCQANNSYNYNTGHVRVEVAATHSVQAVNKGSTGKSYSCSGVHRLWTQV